MSLTLPEIKQKGWQALLKELGYAGATKFMLLFDPGRGNYVTDYSADFSIFLLDKRIENMPF